MILRFRINDYMDLTPVDIVGKRCYQFIHAEDVEGIRQSHLDCEYRNSLLRLDDTDGQLTTDKPELCSRTAGVYLLSNGVKVQLKLRST